METITRTGTQPKLSIVNEDIEKQFKDLLEIPKNSNYSKCFVAAVGDPSMGRDGKEYVPILLVQKRNDLYPNTATEANSFFREWDGFDSIVRHIENVVPTVLERQKLAERSIIPNAQLFVDYRVGEPFYTAGDGTPQDPVYNPQTEMYLGIEGEGALYRNTRIQFTENLGHTGLDVRSKSEEFTTEEIDAIVADSASDETLVFEV